ncbi:putative 2-aminoethylphosphonate ABC transporter substrate-binding protein [Bacillus anthracis]|uniref:putative 2-aminoethylphosphonate ABC transporter substrate-binding protein n=1 Tax=Bacillus anthracis TaxID=1392 RepID=UPI002DBBC30E|nr:putative 2-aminoethylphosphonate ABC transporter substrate-binding protein [Bacillus anthracis]MEB9906786.1 putative 2-aminoethylphosphonate ABC transporter substrate-binding protein [Bacillus anthracis]MEC1954745.1 putative 2-aminoethylphosphonate ABC transporter substrate-binding protein [Bacillus anthracis]
MKKTIFKAVATGMVFSVLMGCGAKKEESAGAKVKDDKLSGSLTVYTAIEEELVPIYLDSFKKKYPDVKLNIVRDSTGVITAKLLAEGKNTQADVVWGTAASSLLALDKKDMLKGYSPKGADRVLPQFKDDKQPEKWVGNTAFMTGIAINKEELKKKNLPMPESYEDLTKPEYKGTLVMPHPASSGTGFLTVSAWLQIMGEDKGWDYMKKLHDNMATYTHSGSKPAKLAGAGEYPVGVSMVYSALKEKQKGAPVEVVLPKEGLGWEVEANALIKKDNVKNEKLAQAFLDWAITDDVMKLYFEKNGFATIKNDYKLPDGFPKDVTEKLYKKNDFKWAAENRDKILEKWEKEFGQKAEPKK